MKPGADATHQPEPPHSGSPAIPQRYSTPQPRNYGSVLNVPQSAAMPAHPILPHPIPRIASTRDPLLPFSAPAKHSPATHTVVQAYPSRNKASRYIPQVIVNHASVLSIAVICTLLFLWRVTIADWAVPFRLWTFDGDVRGIGGMGGAGRGAVAKNGQLGGAGRNATLGDKVKLELFVMSKCPDAVYCEGVFANVLQKVKDITDFDVHYIGARDPQAKYGVTCKHGDDECLGNIQQLCLHHYPTPRPPSTFFNYILCTNRDFRSIPSLPRARECAKLVGLNYDTDIAPCADGDVGRELLRRDVEVGRARGVGTSCTVQINEKLRCVRDGGAWGDEKDPTSCPGGAGVSAFVKSICEAYKGDEGDKPKACLRV
ncbi:uncharacterized protein EV422DRAFT_382146 [Fimicolochytrium jonesii]|uniref:uncharacterized protein n=1 Tax=Fimicolochytrium jonesii TaxID=1396493 RepID=UPI0022FE8E82|nr:uncharacterized protein EV422DRAFT_382146 [Fimicolochytrium jonesii]KAI8822884.1 hypothetical protein EV422DRAFT_382146 [Fimicolochytrium jonesii]